MSKNKRPRCTIWLDRGWINIRADYHADLAPTLKTLIQPPSHRRWDPHADGSICPGGGFAGRCQCKGKGWWLVDPSHLDKLIPVLEGMYDVTVLAPEQPVAAEPSTGQATCLCSCATDAEIKGFYRTLAQNAHPDKGGSSERMARVNALWSKIKKERGMS